LGLQIEEITTLYFNSDFSEQVTVIKLNMDIETLLKNNELTLP